MPVGIYSEANSAFILYKLCTQTLFFVRPFETDTKQNSSNDIWFWLDVPGSVQNDRHFRFLSDVSYRQQF